MLNIQIIIGSVRKNRFAEKPAKYVYEQLKKHDDVKAELVDLKDWPLPLYDEAGSPSSLDGKLESEVGRKWAANLARADAFIIVAPEYNYGYPAAIKNAIDWAYKEWNYKAVGFVSYGTVMGARSVEQLRQVAIGVQMFPIRPALHIPMDVFMAGLKSDDPAVFSSLSDGPGGDRVENFLKELIKVANGVKSLRENN